MSRKRVLKPQREIDPEFNLVLTDVYNGIEFETQEGLRLGVCMRDGGYEITLLDREDNELESLSLNFDGIKINHFNQTQIAKNKKIAILVTVNNFIAKEEKVKRVMSFIKENIPNAFMFTEKNLSGEKMFIAFVATVNENKYKEIVESIEGLSQMIKKDDGISIQISDSQTLLKGFGVNVTDDDSLYLVHFYVAFKEASKIAVEIKKEFSGIAKEIQEKPFKNELELFLVVPKEKEKLLLWKFYDFGEDKKISIQKIV